VTRTTRRLLLGFTIAIHLLFLLAFVANRELLLRDPARPAELDGLARHLADHPADWLAASAITDQSLDSLVPRRLELWRAAYEHGKRLAPNRANADAAFARAGLFHWYELAAKDRADVLAITGPLLRDPRAFRSMHRPLWQLTGDLAYLRKYAPDDPYSLNALLVIAATNGRFNDYRELRTQLARKRLETFHAERGTRTSAELVALLPPYLDRGDDALVRGIIEELSRRPIATEAHTLSRRRVQLLLSFAHRNGIDTSGLDNLVGADLTTLRADTSSAWQGLCGGSDVCESATATLDGPIALTIENAQSDEVPPYVEIYVDDVLAHEGAVENARQFTLNDDARHRVEVRVANPRTRNRYQRRVRLS